MQAQTAVAQHFREGDILVTEPPLVEAERQAHELETEVGSHGDADHIEEFLFVVCVGGE